MDNMSNPAVAPLDTDLAVIDISMPLLADGVYDFNIAKAELKPTAGGGEMIHLDLVTVDPAMSRTGSMLGAGVHCFNNVNTKPTGKATMDMVKQNMGSLVQAVQFPPGVAGLSNVPQWVPQLIGRVVRCKIGYRPAGVSAKNGKAYKEQNEVLYFTKKV